MAKVANQSLSPERTSSWWGRIFRHPLIWALICASLAWPWYSSDRGLDLLPFLLTLVGGWLCGFTFVNITLSMKNAGLGVLLHLGGAAVLSAMLHWVVFGDSSTLLELPDQLRKLIFLLQMGAIPAAAWIWLGLLSRVTFRASKPSRRAKPQRDVPYWEATSPGTQLRFPAVPLPVQSLTSLIVGSCLIAGALACLLLMAFDSFLLRLASANLLILVVAALIGLPGYYLFMAIVCRKTIPCSVTFGDDRLCAELGSKSVTMTYSKLERLVWRCQGNFARVEIHGHGQKITLLVGVARTPELFLAQLPPLSQRTMHRLATGGLERQRTSRPDLSVFVANPEQQRHVGRN